VDRCAGLSLQRRRRRHRERGRLVAASVGRSTLSWSISFRDTRPFNMQCYIQNPSMSYTPLQAHNFPPDLFARPYHQSEQPYQHKSHDIRHPPKRTNGDHEWLTNASHVLWCLSVKHEASVEQASHGRPTLHMFINQSAAAFLHHLRSWPTHIEFLASGRSAADIAVS
jgi:hypothetical protein